MQLLPTDLIGLVSAVVGPSIVLIQLIGPTARIALNPPVDAHAKIFGTCGADESMGAQYAPGVD
jgi:hypothetical protein